VTTANDTLEQHLIELEKSLLDPRVRADQSQLDQLIADDFVETGATGVTFGKALVLAELPQEEDVAFAGENFAVRMLAPTIGLVTYEGTKTTQNSVRRSKRSSIWVLCDGRWQMTYHQGTLVSS
jgi:hypothetical protein